MTKQTAIVVIGSLRVKLFYWLHVLHEGFNYSKTSMIRILWELFLFYHDNACCMYSLESPHRGYANDYTEHTIF